MSVKLFYDPERTEQFRQRGIDPRSRPQSPETHARTALGAVEESARLRAEVARLKLKTQAPLGAVEECTRLRSEVARLKLENQRLSAEVDRLQGDRGPLPTSRWATREDNAAQRLELDIDDA